MVHNPLLVAALSAGLLAPLAAGMYAKNSPVLQLDHKNFEQKILNSNHASIVEFYAPWCGHCKNLKPAYEAAAGNLKGLANVAAIDCDEDRNKQTCAKYGVQGFPTLKTFVPGKKTGKPTIEDYNGARSAKAIVDWTLDRIPNHVVRVNTKTVEEFLSKGNETVKSILFTTKGVATPLYKALAVDFLGAISFAQVRDKETEVTSIFGIQKYPTLLVLPGGSADGVVYDGEMKKEAMHKFLSGFAKPTEGKTAPKDEKKREGSSGSTESSSTSPETPKPTRWDSSIPKVPSHDLLLKDCATKTCMLVITPQSSKVLTAFEETNYYLHHVKPNMFPFYQIPLAALLPAFKEFAEIDDAAEVPQLRAINVKKQWWVAYNGNTESHDDMKNWADALRMGELQKKRFPDVIPDTEDVRFVNTETGESEPIDQVPSPEEPTKEEEKPLKEAPKHEEL